ncbi:MAG: arginine-tRNA-protein transferase, partial [Acidobacteriota bacterium]
FEPDESARSLGIYLILSGIEYAKRLQLKYYYPGYAYREPSFYDYKKRFQALEAYDWEGRWGPFKNENS